MAELARFDREDLLGDFWGGLSSMLVCLPSALAFGVAIYAPLGPAYAGAGALAGVAGAVALGLLAPLFGDTRGVISVPSGPAAAILGAFAAELVNGSLLGAPVRDPAHVVLLITLVGLLCGLIQLALAFLRGGDFIKFIPYPVTSGFLSGVGVLVFLQQVPALLGLPEKVALSDALSSPELWREPAIAVGAATIATMLLARKLTRRVPAPILALAAGAAVYFLFGWRRPELLRVEGNPLLLGPLPKAGGALWTGVLSRFKGLWSLPLNELRRLFVPAAMMAVLLSFDTLKTCIMVDAMTRTRHDSNRELRGQGIGNTVAALAGGVPGSGMSGAMLINMAAGARTRLAGVIEGVLVLAAFLLFSRVVAYVPLAALGGILSVVAFRMLDRESLRLALQRATWLDFAVTLTVVVFTVCVSLLTATVLGLALTIALYLRAQVSSSVIRRKLSCDRYFSRARRLPEEAALLEKEGKRTLVCELQGSLFFGTADQLFSELLGDLKTRQFIILDLHRVQSVDFTAAHMLEQIEDQLAQRGGTLVFAGFPRNVPTGQDVKRYFEEVGLTGHGRSARAFADAEEAMSWAEDQVLDSLRVPLPVHRPPLDLNEIDLLREFDAQELALVAAAMSARSYAAGETVCRAGEPGGELYLIRKGTVRILLPVAGGFYHLASLGRGDFFGEITFLDRGQRSADTLAYTATELFLLPRERFDEVSKRDPTVGARVFARLAHRLALRLRVADAEVASLQEG